MKPPLKTLCLVLFGCMASFGIQSQAATFTWTGTAGASWGVSNNWSSTTSGTWPDVGDTAVISAGGAYQNVKYDVPALNATGTIGSLSMVQPTTGGTNQVSLWRSLVVSDTNGITLGGANGGTSVLYLDASDTGLLGNSVTLTTSSVTVNTGGVLALSLAGSSGALNSTVNGNVNLNGGFLVLYSNSMQAIGSAGVSQISGSFIMTGGTVGVGVQLPNITGNLWDPRLSFNNNVTITGGVVAGGSATINFNGTNSSVTGLSASNSKFTNLTLYCSNNQTFVSDASATNSYISALTPRANGNLTRFIGSSVAGGTLAVGALNIGQGTATGTTTVLLSSDMMATGSIPLGAGAGVGNTITTVGYALDLNGHNFFAPNAGISLGNPGVTNGTNTAIWNFQNSNSSTPGAVYASFFNFTSGSTVVNVGANSAGVVVLTATGVGQVSNLGYVTNGTIAANSVFSYIGNGAASLTSTGAFRAIGCISVGTGSSASTLNLITGGPTVQGNITVNANAVLNLLDKTVTETGGAMGLGGLSGSGSVYNNGGSGNTAYLILNTLSGNGTFAGTIGDSTTGSGAVGVTLAGGNGIQWFTGTNTYSGRTTINDGNTLQLGDGITDGYISSKSAILNNGNLFYANNKDQTYGGVISGSGAVSIYSVGAQIFTGNNTYSGMTTISSGTMQIGAGGTTGALSGSGAIANYGALVFDRSDTITQGKDFGNSIDGTGKLVQAGSGMLVLNGANTFYGATEVLAGSIKYANRGALYSADTSVWDDSHIDVKAGAGLILVLGGTDGFSSDDVDMLKAIGTDSGGFESGSYLGLDTTNGNFTYDSAINDTNGGTNALGVHKLGANTLTLTGASTYTGATVVAAGELDINGSLSDASAVTVQPGAILGGNGTAYGTVSVQSASIKGNGLKLGDTTFTGASSISGTTSVKSFTVASGTTTARGVTTSSGNISVNAGAKLTNTGVLNGNVNVSGLLNGGGTVNGALVVKAGGELASGNTPMTTIVSGSLTVESTGKISAQINGIQTPGTDFDQYVIKGADSLVSLNAGSILNLSMSISLTAGQTIMIIRNESNQLIVGTFSTVTIGGNSYNVAGSNTFTYNGVQYMLLYNVNGDHSATIANDLELTVVPEPGTWALLTGGLGLLLGARRMRRRTE